MPGLEHLTTFHPGEVRLLLQTARRIPKSGMPRARELSKEHRDIFNRIGWSTLDVYYESIQPLEGVSCF